MRLDTNSLIDWEYAGMSDSNILSMYLLMMRPMLLADYYFGKEATFEQTLLSSKVAG